MFFKKIMQFIFGNNQLNGCKQKLSQPVEYGDFIIQVAPIFEDGNFKIAGFISAKCNKQNSLEPENKPIPFIRADQISDEQMAIDQSILKAKQIIDQQGASLLDKQRL